MDSLIPFTDSMNKLWNLPHNDTSTSECRRNKSLMHKALSQAQSTQADNNKDNKTSVRYGKHFLIEEYLTDQPAFEQQMKSHELRYPIVIKPLTSGGTDGVRLCYTFEACQKVVQRHLHQENGERNTNVSMMAQEFLDGEEYVVNTVSYDGNHKFTDIWRAHKSFHVDTRIRKKDDKDDNNNNNDNEKEKKQNEPEKEEKQEAIKDEKLYPFSMLYDYQEFEQDIIGDEKMQLIVQYVETVLNTLGLKYGCGHCEVMYLPKEKKVCLIELNARMHGGLPRATDLVGYNQMSALALHHCDAGQFLVQLPKYYNPENRRTFFNLLHEDEQESMVKFDSLYETDAQHTDRPKVTVRAIFLRSKVDGKLNMPKLIDVIPNLKTFKMFARSLYDIVEYWKEYKTVSQTYEQQLLLIESSKQADAAENEAQAQDKTADAENGTGEAEIRENLKKVLNIIDRIEEVEKTIDLITCPGTVVLQGKVDEVEADYQAIRAMEDDVEDGLFVAK